ncbi:MAG: CHC2 zinc finger domain-containing protein, partial [Mariprofundaceae bacterium]|nr:CHC2 zinc finger domain-containing protein [Mariprofundaceae bacterium]
MAHFPSEFLDEVLARTDVVELIARHVELKKSGANFMGLCPFHHEKSPSFSVSTDKQLFYCFGCGKGGGAFQFLMEHDGYSFPEAVEYLA